MDQSPAASDNEEMPFSPIGSHRRSTRRKATPKRYSAEHRSNREEMSIGSHRRSTRRKATPKRYDAEHGSDRGSGNQTVSEEEVDVFSDFLRRSPRRKVAPLKYVAEDFREGLCSPTGGKMKRNDLSPNESPKPSRVSFAMMEENESSDLSDKKQEELKSLKEKRFGEIQTSKIEEKQKVLEVRAKVREEQRLCRQKALEMKAKLRVEERERKLVEQEKLRMARSIVKEAQRSSQKRRREREKERKQRELQEMKEKNAEERKRMKELCSVPAMGVSSVVCIPVALLELHVCRCY